MIWSLSLTQGNRLYLYRNDGVEVQIDINGQEYVSSISLTIQEKIFLDSYFNIRE